MNFEVPLVTDMTPVDPPPGAAGAAGGAGGKRYNAITQGWQGNDDEHPEVSVSYVIQGVLKRFYTRNMIILGPVV